MKVEGRHFASPAKPADVFLLREALPARTPSDYFDFLIESDGGEIWYSEDSPEGFDCLSLYSVNEIFSFRKVHQELLPDLLVIGGDQGTQFLAYHMTCDDPWPVIMFLPGWGATNVASSISELRVRYFRPVGETIPANAEHGSPVGDK